MSVRIVRRTGWFGHKKLNVKMNGEHVAKLGPRQDLEITLSDEKVIMSVSEFGRKSNAIEVVDGETIEIKTTIWSKATFALFLFTVYIDSFLLDVQFKVYSLIAIGSVGIFLTYVMNRYHFKKQKE